MRRLENLDECRQRAESVLGRQFGQVAVSVTRQSLASDFIWAIDELEELRAECERLVNLSVALESEFASKAGEADPTPVSEDHYVRQIAAELTPERVASLREPNYCACSGTPSGVDSSRCSCSLLGMALEIYDRNRWHVFDEDDERTWPSVGQLCWIIAPSYVPRVATSRRGAGEVTEYFFEDEGGFYNASHWMPMEIPEPPQ